MLREGPVLPPASLQLREAEGLCFILQAPSITLCLRKAEIKSQTFPRIRNQKKGVIRSWLETLINFTHSREELEPKTNGFSLDSCTGLYGISDP